MARACELPAGGWRVYGRAGTAYDLMLVDGVVCCTCPAGSRSQCCWHSQLVAMLWNVTTAAAAAPVATTCTMCHQPMAGGNGIRHAACELFAL